VDKIIGWFDLYGYWVLFLGLLAEFIALPFPGETVMTYTGYLVYDGRLDLILCVVLAFAGTTLGITATYFIGGALGRPFFARYGSRIHMGPERFEQTAQWFDKYGSKILFIAYFIPGVRHFSGYFSGILRIPFRTFAIYAYSGALFWVILFIGGGYLLGPQWTDLHQFLSAHLGKAISIAATAVVILVFSVKRYRTRVLGLPAVLRKTLDPFGQGKGLSRTLYVVGAVSALIAVILVAFLLQMRK
jgi:membrane protein DedA with SNARE-associated domain